MPDQANVLAVIELLAERFPQCFAVYELRRRPLKVGIRDDIVAAINGAIEPRWLNRALSFYTHNVGYLHSLRAGAVRIDLDGNAAGEVTEEQAVLSLKSCNNGGTSRRQKSSSHCSRSKRRKSQRRRHHDLVWPISGVWLRTASSPMLHEWAKGVQHELHRTPRYGASIRLKRVEGFPGQGAGSRHNRWDIAVRDGDNHDLWSVHTPYE